jgi:hypothetical protein
MSSSNRVPPIDTELARKRSARVMVNNNYRGAGLAWFIVLVDVVCFVIAALAYVRSFRAIPKSARHTDTHTSAILIMIIAGAAMLGVVLWRVRYAIQTSYTKFTGSSVWHLRQIVYSGVAMSAFGWTSYAWFIQARLSVWTAHEATALFVASIVAPIVSLRAVYKHYRTLRHNIAALEAETIDRRQKHSPALGRSPRNTSRLHTLRRSQHFLADSSVYGDGSYVDDNSSSTVDYGYPDAGDGEESSDIGQLEDGARARSRNRRSLRRGGWRTHENMIPLATLDDPPAELSCAPIDQ